MSAVNWESADAMIEPQRKSIDLGFLEEGGSVRLITSSTPDDAERPLGTAPLSLTPVRSSRGALRMGGVPPTIEASGPQKNDAIAAMLTDLAGEMAQLRIRNETQVTSNSRIEARLQKDVAAIKDSIEQLEAFVSITFVTKVNEIIVEKLTVIQMIEASRRRLSRWLAVFIILSLALTAVIVQESRTGQVVPMLIIFTTAINSSVIETSSLIERGAEKSFQLIQGFFQNFEPK